MKKHFFQTFILFLCFAVLSCSNITNTKTDINSNYSLVILIKHGALPDLKVDAYKVSLTNNKGELVFFTETKQDVVKIPEIENGSYNLNISVKNGTDCIVEYNQSNINIQEKEPFIITAELQKFDEKPIPPSTELSISNTKQGIVIKLPPIPEKTSECRIYRKNLSTNTSNDFTIDDLRNYKKQEITDIFVNPGDKYEYYLVYKNWYIGEDENIYYKSKKTLIPDNNGKAIGGVGELAYEGTPKALYDKTKSTITFTSLPTISKSIMDCFTDTTNKNCLKFELVYRPINDYHSIRFPIMKEINCPLYFDNYSAALLGKDLIFDSIVISVVRDGLRYYESFSNSDINTELSNPNIPPMINIKDSKIPLDVKQHNNGLQITLPNFSKIPDLDHWCIDRYYIYNGKEIEDIGYISMNDRNINASEKTIVDYFVEPGVEYWYEVSFWTKGSMQINTIYTKSNKIKAEKGLGDLIIKDKIKTKFTEATGTQIIEPVQTFEPQLNQLKQILNTAPYNYNIYMGLGYSCNNHGYIENDEKHEGILNWNCDNLLGNTAKLYAVYVYANINQVHYIIDYDVTKDPRIMGLVDGVEKTISLRSDLKK